MNAKSFFKTLQVQATDMFGNPLQGMEKVRLRWQTFRMDDPDYFTMDIDINDAGVVDLRDVYNHLEQRNMNFNDEGDVKLPYFISLDYFFYED